MPNLNLSIPKLPYLVCRRPSSLDDVSQCNVSPPAAFVSSGQQVHANVDSYISSINDVMDCNTNVYTSVQDFNTFVSHPQFRNFNISIVPHVIFPDSRALTPVSLKYQWIDMHQSIHLRPTEDVMHMSFSPPPSYISHDACVTEYKDPDVIAEIEDLVQDYLYSDLLMIDDTHTIFILDATQAVYAFTHCQD